MEAQFKGQSGQEYVQVRIDCGHLEWLEVPAPKHHHCLQCDLEKGEGVFRVTPEEKAEKTRDRLLRVALQMAVPLQVDRWRAENSTLKEIQQQAAFCGDVIAEKGDILQFGTKKTKGAVALAFAALARGLAALSFSPGGVEFLGIHFESSPEWLRQPGSAE